MGGFWLPDCFLRSFLLIFVAANRKSIRKRKLGLFTDHFGILHSSFCVLVALFL
jgi:hypothetical protein